MQLGGGGWLLERELCCSLAAAAVRDSVLAKGQVQEEVSECLTVAKISASSHFQDRQEAGFCCAYHLDVAAALLAASSSRMLVAADCTGTSLSDRSLLWKKTCHVSNISLPLSHHTGLVSPVQAHLALAQGFRHCLALHGVAILPPSPGRPWKTLFSQGSGRHRGWGKPQGKRLL